MQDFVAYLAAQQRTAAFAQEALPSSPVRPDHRDRPLSRRASVALRWLPDQLDTANDTVFQAVASSRC